MVGERGQRQVAASPGASHEAWVTVESRVDGTAGIPVVVVGPDRPRGGRLAGLVYFLPFNVRALRAPHVGEDSGGKKKARRRGTAVSGFGEGEFRAWEGVQNLSTGSRLPKFTG